MNALVDAIPFDQPDSFEFTAENLERAKAHIAKYPPGRQASAVLPLLWIAQYQNEGWLPRAAMDYVAKVLEMAPIRVYEVATFYSMFNLEPVGKWFLQICGTTPDRLFTLVEVECLGACVNAPILQVNDDFYEDLDGSATEALLDALRDGKPPPSGSMIGRQGSEPVTGRTTLTEPTGGQG